MAKAKAPSMRLVKPKKRRPGVHSKNADRKKKYRGQGR